jgi:uncharacterized membrane protein (UPF0182 family)
LIDTYRQVQEIRTYYMFHSDSRIMIRRTLQDRMRTLAPFLRLDHDPYVVISAGRLLWMQDAYTTSAYFPYARAFPRLGLNYIRNAAKVVINAYNGTVDLYIVDPADPIAATYFLRRNSSTGHSRSRPASTRTPRSPNRSRCGIRRAPGLSAATCW